MSFHNQSEFIISTGNKRPQDISKILNSTLDEAIKSISEFYTNDNKIFSEKLNAYHLYGGMYQIKINHCIDLLMILEENETKRLAYSDCYKYTLGIKGYLQTEEFKTKHLNELSRIREMSDIQHNLENCQQSSARLILEDYSGIYKKINCIDREKMLQLFNQNINLTIANFVKIKAVLYRMNNNNLDII